MEVEDSLGDANFTEKEKKVGFIFIDLRGGGWDEKIQRTSPRSGQTREKRKQSMRVAKTGLLGSESAASSWGTPEKTETDVGSSSN